MANKGNILKQDDKDWNDIRIVPGSFSRPGVSDPTIVTVAPSGGGNTYMYEFAKNDIVSFSVQIPHSYQEGTSIGAHVHWTPGDQGNEENGNTVGWKIDYTWANVDGAFGTIATADCSDACNGTDWEHNMTPEVELTGSGKTISSMLICNLKRTDTGADDTWSNATSGSLPLLLEIDFHFKQDTLGSNDSVTK